MRVLLCVCAVALVVPCLAHSKILATGSPLDVKIESEEPVLETAAGPTVRGSLLISPHPIKPVCDRLVFYVDDEVKLATDAPSPRLVLDTTGLSDGQHALRIEAERGRKLFISTGSIALCVANTEGAAVLDSFIQMPEKASPSFEKLYRARLAHEAVWFNGEEGDLERHAFVKSNRIYITLTDLLRHIGGQLIWGPGSSYIEVHRNDVTMRITPGSKIVKVNNNRVDIQRPVVVRGGRTYIPVRAVCDLFGVYIEWNKDENRAYVYAPQPSYAVARREYPWVSPLTGDPMARTPGSIGFRNRTGLPIHVRFQGNGFMADWQIRAYASINPVFIAPGTYEVTIWSRQGEDYEDHITVASGVSDTYDIGLHPITLSAH